MDGFEENGLAVVPVQAREAQAALEALKAPADQAAQAIGEAFERAGKSLSRSLVRAAADGKISLAEVAGMVLDLINSAARSGGSGGGSGGGLSEAIAAAAKGFSGTRAEGGPVMAGGAYLVGERGPEVFRPGVGGMIEPGGATGGVTVNLSIEGGAEGVLRSEAQIARMLARATALGARGL